MYWHILPQAFAFTAACSRMKYTFEGEAFLSQNIGLTKRLFARMLMPPFAALSAPTHNWRRLYLIQLKSAINGPIRSAEPLLGLYSSPPWIFNNKKPIPIPTIIRAKDKNAAFKNSPFIWLNAPLPSLSLSSLLS
jgi:hypothetical protein